MDLTKTQKFHIHESMEVVMVSKNKELVFAAFQVVALSLKGFNNGQELLIVSFIAGLSKYHLLREKNY